MKLIFKHHTIILDASCVISLYATRKMGEILQSLPPHIAIATYVAKIEAKYIRGDRKTDGTREKVPIDLSPYINKRLLKFVNLENEQEAQTVTHLAKKIRGRGEIETAAIAINRQWGMVIDDRRARNLFQSEASNIQILSTLDLVRYWETSQQVKPLDVQNVVQNMEAYSSFFPKQSDPNYEWWYKSYHL